MERVLLAAALVTVATAAAALVRRRARPSGPARSGHAVPDHVDRGDFTRPDAPVLVVAFSSRTCLSCADTWAKVAALESGAVAVEDVPYQDRRDLHDRYAIDAVPIVLVAGQDGAVRASFVGPPTSEELQDAIRAAAPPA